MLQVMMYLALFKDSYLALMCSAPVHTPSCNVCYYFLLILKYLAIDRIILLGGLVLAPTGIVVLCLDPAFSPPTTRPAFSAYFA